MSAPQTPGYRPAPVTQRDGSAYANSNCRMASIATGLEYDTRGAKRSTGAKMRDYSGDTSGGSNSGDARRAWDLGYDEGLTVRDGNTFDSALGDLRAGRLVHLDVWHATLGGPCLSGSGAYGHTVAVLPDCDGAGWLVADPWCSPGKWAREPESQLRAASEKWGHDVYGTTAGEPDYPTGDRDPRSAVVLAIVERVVTRLMSERYPGGPELGEIEAPDTQWETGGGQPILYTVTAPIALEEESMQAPELPAGGTPMVVTMRSGTVLYRDSDLTDVYGTLGGERELPFICKVPGFGEGHWVVAHNALAHYVKDADIIGEARPALAGDAEAAVAERDAEWRDWVLEGSPGTE